MKKGFTGIVKGLLIAGVIIGCLASMIVAIGFKIFWIFLGGVFVSFVAFSAVGMVVEISQNIAKCGEMLDSLVDIERQNRETLVSAIGSANGAAEDSTNTVTSSGIGSVTAIRTNAVAAKSNPRTVSPPDSFWICPDCGTQNEKAAIYCKNCGRYK